MQFSRFSSEGERERRERGLDSAGSVSSCEKEAWSMQSSEMKQKESTLLLIRGLRYQMDQLLHHFFDHIAVVHRTTTTVTGINAISIYTYITPRISKITLSTLLFIIPSLTISYLVVMGTITISILFSTIFVGSAARARVTTTTVATTRATASIRTTS